MSSPARSRRFRAMRRMTPQARKAPNSSTEAVSPLARRCENAQIFTDNTMRMLGLDRDMPRRQQRGDQTDHGDQHQRQGDVRHPYRRIVEHARHLARLTKAVDQQDQREDADDGVSDLPAALAKAVDHGLAKAGRNDADQMKPEENDDARRLAMSWRSPVRFPRLSRSRRKTPASPQASPHFCNRKAANKLSRCPCFVRFSKPPSLFLCSFPAQRAPTTSPSSW